jgi:hypothetical protein
MLLLRRGGATWGVAHDAVRALVRRDDGGFEVTMAAGAALVADEVLGVTALPAARPAGGVLRRFWPEAARGLAVHAARPLVIIDPAAPPRALVAAWSAQGGPLHGE